MKKLHQSLQSALRKSSTVIPCPRCEEKDQRIAELEAQSQEWHSKFEWCVIKLNQIAKQHNE